LSRSWWVAVVVIGGASLTLGVLVGRGLFARAESSGVGLHSDSRLAQEFLSGLPARPVDTDRDTGRWEGRGLGGRAWSGYTIAVSTGQTVCFLHGRDVEVLGADGGWECWEGVLPWPIGPFSDAAWDWGEGIVVVGGGEPGFRLDLGTRQTEEIPGLAVPSLWGTRVACDSAGVPYCAQGGGTRVFGRVRNRSWERLQRCTTVNPLGAFSAALYWIPGRAFVAFGDHHIGRFDDGALRWPAPRAYFVMRFRPAADRGGMVCQDPETYDLYVTLGKGSRSLGVADVQSRRFFHLRPKLPIALREWGRTLFITGEGDGKRLNLLSLADRAIYSIRLGGLHRIGEGDRLADDGSRWEIWNTSPRGSHGELVREKDSVCNVGYVGEYVYVQRKNLVRRFDRRTLAWSENGAGYKYGRYFLAPGAGLCTDGGDRFYLCTGHDQSFYALELKRPVDPGTAPASGELDIKHMAVSRLAALPEAPVGNTPMAYYRGSVYALFDPVTRVIHRYDVESDRWEAVTVVPSGVGYTTTGGADLVVVGDELVLLSGGWMARYRPERGWGEPVRVCFNHTADGGMAVADSVTELVYVAIGGGSRDLGVVSVRDGRSAVLEEFFPDPVSVHGRRMGVIQEEDGRYLYIYRGHDSAEFWRTGLPGGAVLLDR
jgi:hypothetical protein